MNNKGFVGEIKVAITVEGGKITDISAEGNGETEDIGSIAVSELPSSILAAGTYQVDSISSSTISSTAIEQAAKAAMHR